ncbi:MAG: hypothetical protein HRT37_05650 [Alteromonadaceae bacterium]|nr:hypothetical protein [Alteromonadaceae bacterium]
MIAVLTGDIVRSTKMSNDTYTETIRELQSLLHDANEKYQAIGDIYRGDEFQIQYPNPIHAINSTLLIKLSLQLSKISPKPIQCTLSLAYGEYEVYSSKPNTSSGPVFIESGRGLEKTLRGDISLSLSEKKSHEEIQLLTQFLNHQLNRLTRTQAELLYKYIESGFAEHRKIAEITNTTRQNISNRLNNIGAFLVRDYIKIINSKVEQFRDKN